MAISNITTEDGNRIVQETVAGITGASTLNDSHVETINVEPFLVNPITNLWLIGSGWSWNSTNHNMQ